MKFGDVMCMVTLYLLNSTVTRYAHRKSRLLNSLKTTPLPPQKSQRYFKNLIQNIILLLQFIVLTKLIRRFRLGLQEAVQYTSNRYIQMHQIKSYSRYNNK